MANKKISELVSRTPSLTDLMLVGDPSSGYSYKCTVTALATIIETDIADGYVTLATAQTISGAKTFSNILTLTNVANSATDTDKFLVLTASNTVNYRTGAQVLSDIGGASASSISGTTNYVAKFTSSSAVGNSIIFDNGTNVGISTTSPSYKLDVNGTLRSTDSSYFATSSGNIGIGTNSVTGIGGPILHIHAPTYPEIHLTNSTTGDQFQDGTSIHVSGSSLNILNYESGSINLSTSGTQRVSIASDGNVTLSVIANATTDTDKFLVSDSGVIKYRTGAELLSDIGGASAASYVPYTGATTTVNLGTNLIQSGLSQILGDNATSGGYLGFKQFSSATSGLTGFTSIFAQGTTTLGISYSQGAGLGRSVYLSSSLITNNFAYYYYFPDKGGTFALLDDITGSISGSTNYIPKFTGANTLGNSVIYESGGNIGIGTTSPGATYSELLQLLKSDVGRLNITHTNTTGQRQSDILFTEGTGLHFQLGTILSSGTYSDQIWLRGVANIPMVFYTNDTERMRLDASGNLGIGTTSPSNILHLYKASEPEIYLQSSGATFRTGLNSDNEYFVYSANAKAIYFANNGSERMRITSGGNVGIGTTNPTVTVGTGLEISGSYGVARLTTTNTANASFLEFVENTTQKAFLQYRGSTNANGERFEIYNGANTPTLFFTNNSERMRITSGGLVGIGTTTPESYYSGADNLVVAQGSGEGGITIATANNTTGALYFADGTTGTEPYRGGIAYIHSTDVLTLVSGGAEKMRITSGGNVGIGTTSLTAVSNYITQTINGLSGCFTEYQENGTNAFRVGSDASEGGFFNQTNAKPIRIFINSAERMRITSGGDIGIGTTSPGAKLEVNGAIKTAAPSGGTAQPWKLGSKVAAIVTLDAANYIEVEVNGVAYKLAIVN